MALRQAKNNRRSRVCTSALLDSVAILKQACSVMSHPAQHVTSVQFRLVMPDSHKKSAAGAGMQMVHVAVRPLDVSSPSLPLLVLS